MASCKWIKLGRPLTAADVGLYVRELRSDGRLEAQGVVEGFETYTQTASDIRAMVAVGGYRLYADPDRYLPGYVFYVRAPSGFSILAEKERQLETSERG